MSITNNHQWLGFAALIRAVRLQRRQGPGSIPGVGIFFLRALGPWERSVGARRLRYSFGGAQTTGEASFHKRIHHFYCVYAAPLSR
jgi:hypothetical protein